MEQETTTIEWLFVQTAADAAVHGNELVLIGVDRTTICFSDRPVRVSRHVRTDEFAVRWGQGEWGFIEDPPNAELVIFKEDGSRPETATLAVRDPIAEGDTLRYTVTFVGEPPSHELGGGRTALFIDPGPTDGGPHQRY